MKFIASKDEIEQLRLEYENGKVANFQPEEELFISFREFGWVRIPMATAKRIIDEADLSLNQRFFTLTLELNQYGN